MKTKFINYFMDVAERTAQMSYAKRLKVGTVIVKNDRIISCGYNGLPAGWEPNNCEYDLIIEDETYQELSDKEKVRFREYKVYGQDIRWKGLKTYDEVIHSEANAIGQLASSTESGIGATLFCTHSPCLQCSKIIYNSGIKTLYYKLDYRDSSGIEFLKKCGVNIIKVVDQINN